MKSTKTFYIDDTEGKHRIEKCDYRECDFCGNMGDVYTLGADYVCKNCVKELNQLLNGGK